MGVFLKCSFNLSPMRKLLINKILKVGRFLFEAGVVDYFSGNLSIRWKNQIFITRSGSPLPLLKPQDVILIKEGKPIVGKPSSEYIVHRAIYEKTDHRAVAHAHPPTVVKIAFQMEEDKYIPRDSEGRYLLGEVPIVRVSVPSASKELAEAVSEKLKKCPCVVVYSHGVFCVGDDLEKAAGLITALEQSAKVFK